MYRLLVALDRYQLDPPLHTFLLERKRWQPKPVPLPVAKPQASD